MVQQPMLTLKVYVETTIVSYLAARPSRDIVVAGHQRITEDWWRTERERFALVTSQLVVQEAAAGDPEAARLRLDLLGSMTLLDVTVDAQTLAERLVAEGSVPERAAADALHIAVAVTNGVEYLLTWNCRHLANAIMRPRIEQVCRSQGYEPVIICTPEELFGDPAS